MASIAAPVAAICFFADCSDNAGGEKTADNNSKAAIENIMTRTSVRSYKDQPVEKDIIETMLKAGMVAPSAVNKQPWHFYVVTDKTKRLALAETSPNAKMVANAPLAIVVCGDMNLALEGDARSFWVQDCSAASENILLAAHALGLGGVWTGTYPSQERCDAVRKVLDLPSNLIPLNTIVIGYPDCDNKPKDKWDPAKVTYL